jgi:hypothetical protein
MIELFEHWCYWVYCKFTDSYSRRDFIPFWLTDSDRRTEPGCVVECKRNPNKPFMFTHVKRWQPGPYV